MAQSPFTTKSYILNSLPEEDLVRLQPDLKRVELEHGKVLYLPDSPIEYVYFPDNAMVSVVASTPEGQLSEAGVVGAEGIVGVDVMFGSDYAFNETMIQMPGDGLRMTPAVARREFERGGAFQKVVLKFVRLFMIQISQTALCNRLHTVEERLARWLLLCGDRADGDGLKLTQEFLSIMLGANRATVTTASITLQSSGFINYKRGLITILDREGLEHFACDCYRTVKNEYDRVLK